jgi:V8-like Glu-specific endopeptidase
MKWAARRTALITVTGALAASAVVMTVGTASARPHPPSHAPALTSSLTAGATTVTGHAAAVTSRQQAGVRRYWTRARMERATPLHPTPVKHLLTSNQAGQTGHAGRGGRTGQAGQVVGQRTPVAVGGTLAVPPQAPPTRPLSAAGEGAAGDGAAGDGAAGDGAATDGTAEDGAEWSGGGAVARTTGKVFFSMGSDDYVCSGSTVASANADVVITAGHCAKNGTGAWATNWTFVPGYSDGKEPYGSFTAKKFYVASQWSTQADNDYDVAFVTLNPAKVNGTSVDAGHEVGGQGIEFGHQPRQVTAFGYPADPPYSGGQLDYCGGKVSPDPYHETDDTGLNCAMTAGSSGGPWLAGFSPATGTGTIVSVSSFKYSNNNQLLYGAPLGSAAQQLYQSAAAS